MSLPDKKIISVLYVENDPGMRRLVVKNLERKGFKVDTSKDGEEGLSMQKMNSYDIILIDQNMPLMKGTEFIKVISPNKKLIPVVMVTGSGNEAIAAEAMKSGASDYIIKDPQGGFIELLPSVINRAIKENELSKDKEKLLRELERSNKELDSFAHIASHDLQEPLRKIITFADRLSDLTPNMEEKGKDYLLRMINAAERMQVFIDDLLKYSKVTNTERTYEFIDLNEIVHLILNDLETLIAKTKGVINLTELPTLQANSMQMRQLFQNLISNALKFQKKDISPVVRITSSNDGSGNWEIRIVDNGIGFDSQYADQIFKMFKRLHGRADFSGTGIGLAICEKIVMFHNGKIAVKSEIGEGTTFTITLPEKQLQSA